MANANQSPRSAPEVQTAPVTIAGILSRLGPGLIIAGSIVGSGELIATTKTGAEAGFWLLWLILIGCLVKVFTQVEFGRFSIITGRTTMEGLNQVPGPRLRVNWIVWYWLVMFLASLGQLGGIVGGVGQAVSIVQPLTSEGERFNRYHDLQTRRTVAQALIDRARDESGELGTDSTRLAALTVEVQELDQHLRQLGPPPENGDDILWATVIAVATSIILVVGRYGTIQAISAVLVSVFTFITIGNLLQLQSLPDWRVSWQDLANGMSFRLSVASEFAGSPLATALATLGIIGVGANELVAYPYWCLEKGYARWTGFRDRSQAWVRRAQGWIRVLRWDAWCSAVIYTFATVAFYLLGAAVLGRSGLNPSGIQMVRTLAEMYVPVFGQVAQPIFLFGAVAVLYSTFFVANAGHARVGSDVIRVYGIGAKSSEALARWQRLFSLLFPLISLLFYSLVRAPVKLVLLSGVMQAIMLPMLGAAALYFRYTLPEKRLAPGKLWDVFLWVSTLGMLLAGGWLALTTIFAKLQI